MNEGIVYVLTNPAMPKMVKIGKTDPRSYRTYEAKMLSKAYARAS